MLVEMLDESVEILNMLAKPVREAFLEKFKNLTEPQVKAIPLILEGWNLLLMAPTGTGKTEAALLPALNKIILSEQRRAGVKLLYITPLRALNRDLLERIEWWASRLDLSTAVRHGDTIPRERRMQTLTPPDILITTPETLQILLTARIFRNYLKSVQFVVVDEVHELAVDKRGAQLSIGLERLEELTKTSFQRIGLSATIGSPEEVAKFLVGEDRDYRIVQVPVSRNLSLSVEYPEPTSRDYELADHLSILPDVAARLSRIRQLVEEHESTLIFTNTRPLAEILTNRFRAWDENIPIGIHHGSLARSSRISTEHALKQGKLTGIVCTSSLEMGIDVGRIELCIQYNSPREVTRLVQRVGRSGHRIGGVAKGVIIVMDSDDALEALAIARKALNDEIEPARIPKRSYDVLMHQLAGLIIEKGEVKLEEALTLFKRSYCFTNTTLEDLRKIAGHMKEIGVANFIEEENKMIKPFKLNELYDYYFSNLSMIPEEKQYLVVNEATGEPVGVLDEEFVAEYGDPGTRFILMGKAWEIIATSGERIFVNPLENLEGAVPSWVGDEIPVSLQVATEVGEIRREYREALENNREEDVLEILSLRYNTNAKLLLKSLREVKEHVKQGIPVPTDKEILIEQSRDYVILHIHGGLRVNRTLSRVLGYELSKRVGAGIGVEQDPYRIILKSSYIDADMVVEALNNLQKDDWMGIVKKAVEASGIFRRRLVHAARKMGVLSSRASILDISMRKLAEMLQGSVVYEEALNYTLFEDFDPHGAYGLLKRIYDGEIKVEVVNLDESLSPLAKLTLQRHEYDIDVIASDRIQRLVANAVRGRLNNEQITLICLTCFRYLEQKLVKELDTEPKCPECGSQHLGVLKAGPEKVYPLVSRRGRPSNRAEKQLLKEAKQTARLVEKYGKAAAFVLASKYITPSMAGEILEQESSLGTRLVELVIEAEKKALQSLFH